MSASLETVWIAVAIDAHGAFNITQVDDRHGAGLGSSIYDCLEPPVALYILEAELALPGAAEVLRAEVLKP